LPNPQFEEGAPRKHLLLLSIALVAAALAFLGLPGRAGASVYWTNFFTGTIGRADNDGTNVDQEFIQGLGNPYAVAVDSGHIYWTSFGVNAIGRANLDGTEVEPEFIPNAPGYGIAVDAGHIYWTSPAETIGRANLDGTGVDNQFIEGVTGPRGILVDSAHVYWGEQIEVGEEEFEATIAQANLAGGEVGVLVHPDTLVYGLAIDSTNLYWSLFSDGEIAQSDPTATSYNEGYIEGLSGPGGLALDSTHLYWSAQGTNSIGRTNLSTETVEPEFITGAVSPEGVAVDSTSIKATPTIATVASGSVALGGKIDATATLGGGNNAAGEIKFALYGPDDPTCAGPPLSVDQQEAGGAGAYQSSDFTPVDAGTYRWVSGYSGNIRNNGVQSGCAEPSAAVSVIGNEADPVEPEKGGSKGTVGAPAPNGPGPASNDSAAIGPLRLVKVARNRSTGVGMVRYFVPGAGTLVISGEGVVRRSRTFGRAGLKRVRLVPRGPYKERLERRRRGFTALKVVFTPQKAGSAPERQSRRVRLVKR
jgi:hypothetical protein